MVAKPALDDLSQSGIEVTVGMPRLPPSGPGVPRAIPLTRR